MGRKLRNSRGETLVEVLASILICFLSVLLLFGAVGASGSMGLAAQAADARYYDDLSRAERQSGADACFPPPAAKITVSNSSGAVDLDAGKLTFYGTERLLSYAVVPSPPVPETRGGG